MNLKNCQAIALAGFPQKRLHARLAMNKSGTNLDPLGKESHRLIPFLCFPAIFKKIIILNTKKVKSQTYFIYCFFFFFQVYIGLYAIAYECQMRTN